MKRFVASHIVAFAIGILIRASFTIGGESQGQDRQFATPGITQEIVLNTTLGEFPGKCVLMFVGDFEPGASTPKHKHHGTEFLFVLDGEGVIEQAGGPSYELNLV